MISVAMIRLTLSLAALVIHYCNAGVLSSHYDINDRIFNGSVVSDRTKFPYQVFLRFNTKTAHKYNECGGSLISTKWVLTAGHCCYNPYSGGRAVFGTLATHRERGSQLLNFNNSDIYINGNYTDDKKFRYDICLIKMPKEVKLNSKVALIQIMDGSKTPDDYVGQMATIAGWGKYDDEGGASKVLRVTTDEVISQAVCKSEYSNVGLVADSQVCTSKNISGTCKGDSGGPLTIDDTDGQRKQIGLTSFGDPTCSKPKPNVFTFVPKFMEWIQSTIADNS